MKVRGLEASHCGEDVVSSKKIKTETRLAN